MGIGTGAGLAISAGLGALGSASSASAQRRAAERAAQPQPFERHDSQAPWAPAIPYLETILPLAGEIFEQRRALPPPPTRRRAGASSQMREIANEALRRSMTSQFVPQAQNSLLGFLSGPGPMIADAAAGAANFGNPYAAALFDRGFFGGGLVQNPYLGQFMQNLPHTSLPRPSPALPPPVIGPSLKKP